MFKDLGDLLHGLPLCDLTGPRTVESVLEPRARSREQVAEHAFATSRSGVRKRPWTNFSLLRVWVPWTNFGHQGSQRFLPRTATVGKTTDCFTTCTCAGTKYVTGAGWTCSSAFGRAFRTPLDLGFLVELLHGLRLWDHVCCCWSHALDSGSRCRTV